jgi:hypothetical protein
MERNMSRIDISRLSFFLSAITMAITVSFAAGLYSYHTKNFAFRFAESGWTDIKAVFFSPEQRPVENDQAWRQHLQPSRGQGEGVTVNKRTGDGAKILMVGFFDGENQARLVSRDGSVIGKWSLNFFEHFPDQSARPCKIKSPLYVDIHGAHLTPKGELVANYEYCGTVKVDHCGNLLWRLEEITHHSLTKAQAGGYWIIGREEWQTSEQRNRFPPFSAVAGTTKILEDVLLKVSDEGEILERVSIPQLLYDSGLEALLTASGDDFTTTGGSARNELVHTNKIAELSEELSDSFPLFSAGDLALSLRELNLVLVIDGATRRVKWHQTGPWLRQHDPEFRPDGRLSIFNNNVYKTAYNGSYTRPDAPLVTNILAIDPVTGETEIIYGQRPGQEMLSVIRGQHELLPGGGMIITEFDAGRVLEVDADGNLVWEYVNLFDDDFVGEITNAALYDSDYFTVDWDNCE